MPSGGYRPAGGRPRKPLAATIAEQAGRKVPKKFKTALEYAMHVINDPNESKDLKARLAIAAMPFQHPKLEAIAPAGGGKKDRQQVAAEEAGVGRFAPPEPPRLVAVNG